MTWVKLDDAFTDHPKVMAAGPLASWLHVCGLTYCSRLLTDGFIPAGQVRKLADVDNAGELAEQLVAVGLWDRCEGGFRIHDYLDYNPSREDALAKREHVSEVRREAGRAGGMAKAANQQPSKSVANDVANCQAVASDESWQNASPVPVPQPVPTPVVDPVEIPAEKPTREVATAVAVVDSPHAVVEAFLDAQGTPHDEVSPAWRSKQRAIAKRLLEQGFGVDAVRRCTVFMLSETWRGPFDLFDIERFIGKWEARGSPTDAASLRAQRPAQITDLSPGMQAILTTDLSDIIDGDAHRGRDHLPAKNGRPAGVLADPRGNSPGVVATTPHLPRGDAAGRR